MTNKTTNCPKCQGTGYVSPRVSRGCAGDICFRCNGRGVVTVSAPRKARAAKVVEYVNCYVAGWIVNGQVCGGACEYYATEEAAIAAAASHTNWSVKEGQIPASNARMIRTTA